MAGMKTASGDYIDSSWELRVFVGEEDPEAQSVTLRVTGESHIGGVLLKIVEEINRKQDWSDHAIWWEQKRQWLLQTHWTLDKYGILADARLFFGPQHRPVILQLPNRRVLRLRASFSKPLFQAVAAICRLLSIRHPEELSLLRAPEKKEKKKKEKEPEEEVHDLTKVVLAGGVAPTLFRGMPAHFSDSAQTEACYHMLSRPQPPPDPLLLQRLPRPSSLSDKTQLHSRWLDSSRCLMQQGVKAGDVLWLRFKYYSFFDLDPKTDPVRLTQLYEQARWDLLTEEIDCTEEEMMVFAALQYHINKLSLSGDVGEPASGDLGLDDLDAALNNLEVKLKGSAPSDMLDSLTTIPELKDHLRIFRPRKLTLKGYRQHWVVFKDTTLSYYKSQDESPGDPIQQLNLKGCEVVPDVNVSGQKFCIKLLVPSPEGMSEIYLRCQDEQQYAQWMAACRLASKGRTMADSSYASEVQAILAFLSLQRAGGGSGGSGTPQGPEASAEGLNPYGLVAPRFQRKFNTDMALAARLLPLPGRAARLRTLGAAEVRLSLVEFCCLCRRRLGSSAAPVPRCTWVRSSPALRSWGPRRPLLRQAELPPSLSSLPTAPSRRYSTEEQPQQRQKPRMIILGFSNPINWVRTRIYAFLIWAYFDKDFSIAEFSEGAKQAFAHVSKLLSQCKFDLLEELVTKEVLQVLKEKVTSLSDNRRSALAADVEDIVYTSTGDISIYYDEKGRKFVNILMCFWYLTSADIPSESLSGASVFQVKLGDQSVETKQLLSASYEFQREFTQGVKPDWTIARIEHSKLLE